MIYLKLYLSFCLIGVTTIGGGYASLPIIQHQIVEVLGWMNMTQYADLLIIEQMVPGPIFINAATFVGVRVGGFFGAVVATAGSITPSLLIMSVLAVLFKKYGKVRFVAFLLKGIRPAVIALITYSAAGLLALAVTGEADISLAALAAAHVDLIAIGLTAISLILMRVKKLKISPVGAMLIAGAAGLILYPLIGA